MGVVDARVMSPGGSTGRSGLKQLATSVCQDVICPPELEAPLDASQIAVHVSTAREFCAPRRL